MDGGAGVGVGQERQVTADDNDFYETMPRVGLLAVVRRLHADNAHMRAEIGPLRQENSKLRAADGQRRRANTLKSLGLPLKQVLALAKSGK